MAEKPAEKPQPKVSEPKQEKEQAKEGVVVLTTKVPAKLAAGQTAITATRLELGKSVVFRMTGAARSRPRRCSSRTPTAMSWTFRATGASSSRACPRISGFRASVWDTMKRAPALYLN